MTKPREWHGYHSGPEFKDGGKEYELFAGPPKDPKKFNERNYDDPIHVIEYSAYEELKKERDRMEEHWRMACIAGEELKTNLAIAIEALDVIASFEGSTDKIILLLALDIMKETAKNALEKLK